MEVGNPLQGKRGVSLPFSDQCAPLVRNNEYLQVAVQSVIDYGEKNGWRNIEWRDDRYFAEGTPAWNSYYIHDIDLAVDEAALFASFCPNNRRNIKKAVREGVTVRVEQSLDSLRDFFRLHMITRKRHGVPPQPFAFFKNIHEYIMSKNSGIVVSARHNDNVIAASVFFNFGSKAIFKYGASELRYHPLRPNNLVMWEALKFYHHQGLRTMSLARTEVENHGLLRYKRAWGGKESALKYIRYDVKKRTFLPHHQTGAGLSRHVFARTPRSILRLIGRLLYKYVG
jgi:lipid II:glycine glycyltransferase (peptidoglycan interpeptide bridge formation enzyme)